jgi:hypothetical protein
MRALTLIFLRTRNWYCDSMRKRKDADNPEWTKDMVRRAKPAAKVFPSLKFPKRKPKRKAQG